MLVLPCFNAYMEPITFRIIQRIHKPMTHFARVLSSLVLDVGIKEQCICNTLLVADELKRFYIKNV